MTHECGHFFIARIFKVKILKFSIGFGKAIWQWQGKNNIEYAIGFLPFGGYVKMLDTREMQVAKSERHLALDQKSFWQKMAVVLAGPLTNLLLGILAFWLMFVIGVKSPKPIIGNVLPNSIASQSGLHANGMITAVDGIKTLTWHDVMLPLFLHLGDNDKVNLTVIDPITKQHNDYYLDLTNWRLDTNTFDFLGALGIEPYEPKIPAIVDKIQKNSPAANSDLRLGDKIIKVDGVVISAWSELLKYSRANPQKLLHIEVLRNGSVFFLDVLSAWKFGPNWKKIGYLGISPPKVEWPPAMLWQEQYSFGRALAESFKQTSEFIVFNKVALQKLITRKIPMSVLGGPISIFQSSAQALNQGLVVYIGFLAIFSIMLAFVNLIPIPGLDGGHILIFLLEGIIRRPIPVAVQVLLFKLGLIFLILLAVQATFNDLVRILA